MQDFDAKWITNKDFFALEPINVFHKEMEDVKIPENTAYENKHILFRRTFSLSEFSKAILRIYLEIVRIMPQMVLLFLVFFGTTRAFGWDLSGENASIIVFTFWGAAEMSDLVRGALISIPKHQYESSEALGLSKVQTYWYIIIPQTLRRLIQLSINLITRMIKTTSLILMIGVVEVLKVSQQIIEANRMSSPNAAFGIYLVVFLLYFFACWPISMLAKYLERRWR